MYVNQFDERCEAVYAELNAKRLDAVLDKYEVDTSTRGHIFFLIDNKFAKQIAAEIEIEEGEARSLKASSIDFLNRSGGYSNPAADNGPIEDDGAELLSTIAALAVSFAALV
jgi:hypothetical protein